MRTTAWSSLGPRAAFTCLANGLSNSWPQVSGDHRLDRNEAEAQRIRGAGGDVHREMPEGGPKGGFLRTGTLANARSLGDASNPHVLALPDVQRVRALLLATRIPKA